MSNEFSCNICGFDVTICAANHTIRRMRERELNFQAICGSIISVGNDILDLKNGSVFIIVDNELMVNIVSAIYTNGSLITIDIITVLLLSMKYFYKFDKIIYVGENRLE